MAHVPFLHKSRAHAAWRTEGPGAPHGTGFEAARRAAGPIVPMRPFAGTAVAPVPGEPTRFHPQKGITMRTMLTSSLTAALVLLAGVGHADAQTPPAQETPDPPDREELVTFTEAYIDVTEVQTELSEQVAEAETPEEANALQEEANEEILGILEEKELEADRYREITMVLNADEELRAEFQEIYVELTEGGGDVPD